ncbi:acyl-protein thioesterase 1 [Pseudohyphozyma bogoriensis]|nr:acyl-protein thioesterase 1 [Pseudohyphozyma bogoriensis]
MRLSGSGRKARRTVLKGLGGVVVLLLLLRLFGFAGVGVVRKVGWELEEGLEGLTPSSRHAQRLAQLASSGLSRAATEGKQASSKAAAQAGLLKDGKDWVGVKDYRSQTAIFRERELWSEREEDGKLHVEVVEPKSGVHEETVVYLHGLGQHAWDTPLPFQLGHKLPNVRWVMPQAPDKLVTVRNNQSAPAWFDIRAFPYDFASDEDPHNLFLSARQIARVLRDERDRLIRGLREKNGVKVDDGEPDESEERGMVRKGRGKPKPPKGGRGEVEEDGEFGTPEEREWASSKIVLAGFSQGGVMALLTGLTFKERLGGVVVLSSFMPLRRQLGALIADLDRTTLPVFWGHGQSDPYLLYGDALTSISLLRSTYPTRHAEGGLSLSHLSFFSYPHVEHTWCEAEMGDLEKWFRGVLESERRPRGGRGKGRVGNGAQSGAEDRPEGASEETEKRSSSPEVEDDERNASE